MGVETRTTFTCDICKKEAKAASRTAYENPVGKLMGHPNAVPPVGWTLLAAARSVYPRVAGVVAGNFSGRSTVPELATGYVVLCSPECIQEWCKP